MKLYNAWYCPFAQRAWMAQAPFALRIDLLLGHYREFELPVEGDIWQRYRRWYASILEQPAFNTTTYDQPDYRNRLVAKIQQKYRQYRGQVIGTGSTITTFHNRLTGYQ